MSNSRAFNGDPQVTDAGSDILLSSNLAHRRPRLGGSRPFQHDCAGAGRCICYCSRCGTSGGHFACVGDPRGAPRHGTSLTARGHLIVLEEADEQARHPAERRHHRWQRRLRPDVRQQPAEQGMSVQPGTQPQPALDGGSVGCRQHAGEGRSGSTCCWARLAGHNAILQLASWSVRPWKGGGGG